MKKILVDTSIIIDYLRQKNKTNSLLFQIFSQKKYLAVVSLTTVSELWAGKSMAKKDTQKEVKKIIQGCQVVLPNMKIAKLTGKILRQRNYQISFQDAQIAALGLENRLPVLTLNEKDFKKIKGIKLFKTKEALGN